MKVVAWWSAGVTSAVACKLALETYGADNVDIIYFKINSAHPDNERFKRQCEEWYGKEIEVVSSTSYKDQFEVIEKTRYINGAQGARCTLELKKKVRYSIEAVRSYDHQIFGFEFDKKEINRALRFLEQYPDTNPVFPLIERGLTKPNCLHLLESNGIRRPKMYELGYPNNNCIGCVKGGIGYWNKIREDFPDHFKRMSELEEKIGATCLKNKEGRIPLKTLEPSRGRSLKIIMPDCGSFCDLEFTDLAHPELVNILKSPESISTFYQEVSTNG